MNALGVLWIMFVAIAVLGVLGSILIFTVKNKKVNDMIMVLMAVFAAIIGFLSFTAVGENEITEKVISCIIGSFAVLGLAYRLWVKKYPIVSKFLIVFSVLMGIIYLFFA